MTCQSCGGSGFLMLTRQSGYMTLRQQVRCDDCNGEGETIKDKCKSCDGQKIKEEKKFISVEINKGFPDGKKLFIVESPTKPLVTPPETSYFW